MNVIQKLPSLMTLLAFESQLVMNSLSWESQSHKQLVISSRTGRKPTGQPQGSNSIFMCFKVCETFASLQGPSA